MASTDSKRKKRKWTHPTTQRTPDEGRRVLGRKNRIVHVRVSDREYAALVAGAKEAGTENVSLFVRSVMLAATERYLDLSPQELASEAAPPTQAASADGKAMDEWLFAPERAGSTSDALDALIPAEVAPPPPAPVTALPFVGLWEPLRATITPPAVSEPVEPPPSAPEPSAAVQRAPVTPEIATKLDMLAQLRSMMGDDAHVGAGVKAMLDARQRPR